MLQKKNNFSLKIEPLLALEIGRIVEIQENCSLSRWTFSDYEEELNNLHALILTAKNEGKIVGFIACRLLADNFVSETREKDDKIYFEAEILNFGVLDNYRQRGIGSGLLKEFLECVSHKSIKMVWLEVRASNVSAIKFYSRRGFIENHRRKNFYSFPSEDAIVMKFLPHASVDLQKQTKLDSERDSELTSVCNPNKISVT